MPDNPKKPEADLPRKGEDIYADYLKQIEEFKERQKKREEEKLKKDILGRNWRF